MFRHSGGSAEVLRVNDQTVRTLAGGDGHRPSFDSLFGEVRTVERRQVAAGYLHRVPKSTTNGRDARQDWMVTVHGRYDLHKAGRATIFTLKAHRLKQDNQSLGNGRCDKAAGDHARAMAVSECGGS